MPRSQNGEWMPSGASVRVCGWGNTRVSEINSQAFVGRGRPHRPRHPVLRRPDTCSSFLHSERFNEYFSTQDHHIQANSTASMLTLSPTQVATPVHHTMGLF